MSLLIGFLGRKRSGKDTCAAALIREFGGSRVSFAHAIKEIAATHFGIPREDIEGDKTALTEFTWEGLPRFYPVDPFAEGSLTVRQFLQWFGTDIMRAIDPDVWIRPAMAAAQRALENGPVYITDVRFMNEVDAILEAGGHIIALTRRVDHDDHPSEAEIDKAVEFNRRCVKLHVLDNRDMTIAENEAAAIRLVRQITQWKGGES